MKNITLLALGIFIGAVVIIYIFGIMDGGRMPNNFINPPIAGNATPFPSSAIPADSPDPTKIVNPTSSVKPSSTPAATKTPSLSVTSTPTPTPTNSAPALTRAEVARHTSRNDCYLIINNKVYNVSSYIDSHPGGAQRILDYCGNEATGIFASIHSNYAWDLLGNYFIGNLAGG